MESNPNKIGRLIVKASTLLNEMSDSKQENRELKTSFWSSAIDRKSMETVWLPDTAIENFGNLNNRVYGKFKSSIISKPFLEF